MLLTPVSRFLTCCFFRPDRRIYRNLCRAHPLTLNREEIAFNDMLRQCECYDLLVMPDCSKKTHLLCRVISL